MELSSLPDDPLLEVLRFLPTEQLLRARGVCRRWRDLALHPSLWKHRCVSVDDRRNAGLLWAVLSLAPCLRRLAINEAALEELDEAVPQEGHGIEASTSRRTAAAAAAAAAEVAHDGRRAPIALVKSWLTETVSYLAGLAGRGSDKRGRSEEGRLCLKEGHLCLEDGHLCLEEGRRLCLEEGSGCAVRELRLKVRANSSWPSRILRRQAGLPASRLRRLEIVVFDDGRFPPNEDSEGDAKKLLVLHEILSAARGLAIAELEISTPKLLLSWPKSAFLPPGLDTPASLKLLEYELRSSPDPLLTFLLETHAATLEVVRLHSVVMGFMDRDLYASFSATPLASCPNLTELCCPLVAALGELRHWRHVTRLAVEMHGGERPRPCLDFLGSATWLVALDFSFLRVWRNEKVNSEAVLDLIVGLSQSGEAALESLTLTDLGDPDDQYWERLGDALPGLPHLSRLHFTVFDSSPPPLSFLRVITPTSAPSLRALVLKVCLPCPVPDPSVAATNGWPFAFVRELRETVWRNPALHVEGLQLLRNCRSPDAGAGQVPGCTCWEDSGVLGLAAVPRRTSFVVCGHPESASCERPSCGIRLELRC